MENIAKEKNIIGCEHFPAGGGSLHYVYTAAYHSLTGNTDQHFPTTTLAHTGASDEHPFAANNHPHPAQSHRSVPFSHPQAITNHRTHATSVEFSA